MLFIDLPWYKIKTAYIDFYIAHMLLCVQIIFNYFDSLYNRWLIRFLGIIFNIILALRRALVHEKN